MKFEMKTPCGLCPFRSDEGRLYVDPERLREFAESPAFICHQTGIYNEPDGDDDAVYERSGFVGREDGSSQHCAGLMIFLEHIRQPNQCMQLAERFDLYDPDGLDMDAPVFRSWSEVGKMKKAGT
jgi:hypothetical protein